MYIDTLFTADLVKSLKRKVKKNRLFLSLAIALISFWTQQTCDGQVEFLW